MLDLNKRFTNTDFLHPALVRIWMRGTMEFYAGDPNKAVTLFESYRTVERQKMLYAQGRTAPGDIVTNALPWHGWHNYGLAIDAKTIDDTGYEALAEILKREGLTWGGDFHTLKDPRHFELTAGLTIVEAQKLLAEGGLMSVWIAVSERLHAASIGKIGPP